MKILVVNMNYLGDALMTTPALAALRLGQPDAEIDTIAGSAQGYGASEVLSMNPHIDRVIARASGGATARCLQLAQVLRRGAYDAVVVLPSIAAYDNTARLAGTPIRLTTPPRAGKVHMADHMLQTVLPLAQEARPARRLVLQVPQAAAQAAAEKLSRLPRAETPLVAVNVGATRPQKRWPAEHFAALAEDLCAAGRVVLLGGPVESDLACARAIREAVGQKNVADLTGDTTIPELAGVIAASDALVTADTGAMHIAAAVGTPVAALFGSTDPGVTGPYGDIPSRVLYKGLPCAPCGKHPTCAGRFDCMRSIAPADVLAALADLLPARPQAARRAFAAR